MKLKEGDALKGVVDGIKPYGAFVKLTHGEVGMIHISEVAEEYVHDINDYLSLGEELTVKVLGRNEEGKLNLSIKELEEGDEEAAEYRHQFEKIRTGIEERSFSIYQDNSHGRKSESEESVSEALQAWIKEAKQRLRNLESRYNLHLEEDTEIADR